MKNLNFINIKNKKRNLIPTITFCIILSFFYLITFSYSYSKTKILLKEEITNPNKKNTEGIENKNLYKKKLYSSSDLIIPTILIGYGVANHNFDSIKNIDYHLKNSFNFSKKQYKFDDLLQYFPLSTVLLLDCFLDDNSNSTIYDKQNNLYITTKSLLTMGILVTTFKHQSKILRPDGSTKNSFPSGHTALAFTGAHLFHKKYGNDYPFISFLGYSTATITGFMRIVNNRHWFSDVVAGAGFGILSTELTYLFMRKNDYLYPEDQTIFLFPEIGPDRVALTINYYF